MLLVATVAGLALLAGPGASVAGTVTGTVKYEGQVPNLRPIKMDADPGCAAKHKTTVENPMLVLGEGNTMANILVRVSGGLPDREWPVPAEPVVLDQNGCTYHPHVTGIMVGQEFKVLNSDGLLHNVHALPKINDEFNMAMPANRTEASVTFDKEEDVFKIKCDVHPWMASYVAVLDHPFHDTTGKDGKFTISGLPAGSYEISAWHEKLGTKTASVTVTEDGSATVDFTMSPPKR